MPINRTAAAWTARQATSEFTSRDIKLPKSVTDRLRHLDLVEARKPTEIPANAIREAYYRLDDDQAIEQIALQHTTFHLRQGGHTQAVADAGVAVLVALREARSTLHPKLADLAAGYIAHIEKSVEIDTELDVLIRANRHDDARVVAEKDVVAAKLDALYLVRDLYLTGKGKDGIGDADYGVAQFNCGRWRDPVKVMYHVREAHSIYEAYYHGIKAGGQLWFPTAEQAQAEARPVYDKWYRQEQQRRSAQSGVGGVAAFG